MTIDFTTFVLSISSAALMGLGLAPRPGNDQPQVDLELARQNIDLLQMIQEKTKNNLTTEEEKLLDNVLRETRMQYVRIQQMKGKS